MDNDLNPYAAPVQPSPGPTPYWTPELWEPSEVIATAWTRFKSDWAVLVGSLVLGLAVVYVPFIALWVSIASDFRPDGPPHFGAAFFVMYAVTLVVVELVTAGWIKVAVGSARAIPPTMRDFFGGMSRALPMFGMAFLLGVAVTLASLALIFPGVILFLGLSLAEFYVVDAGLGPIEALQASWKATTGEKGRLFVLWILLFLIILAGEVACGIGLLVAIPVFQVARAIVYVRLAGRAADDRLATS